MLPYTNYDTNTILPVPITIFEMSHFISTVKLLREEKIVEIFFQEWQFYRRHC